ncbi:MAG: hypothetical protein A3G34_16850 [Candidatus Lindowbacteria bacterium RIFCSPLOWO2_12_FULL_62_27]|nr:MAG: hypothetical protein A3I06_05305 [Candidatus Lindowbacteria bacterium RIFCSPLOWO2_02_FULL_62_12]OGH62897.1 MAG: hypothetical protein A3G34_16850 [Candidatus Lindowbacteria bacterium RIFCSPLOWO2_12_FULL_62_27]
MRVLIGKIILFRGLKPADIKSVAESAVKRKLDRKTCVFHQGEPADTVYVLANGSVKISQTGADGRATVLRVVGSGEMFGCLSIFGDSTYPGTAVALEEGSALAWDGNTMARLMERHSPIALNALKMVVSRLHELQTRFLELGGERVECRLADALARLGHRFGKKVSGGIEIELPISQQDLAEIIGTTIYSVSRILSAWQRRGLVRTGRRRILIRNSRGLTGIAGKS